jgi:hypothetical protein
MTLRTISAVLALTGLVMTASVLPAVGADTNNGKTKKQGQRAAALKNGESTQGTFAYRFDTYSGYTSPTSPVCSVLDPSCTQNLNTDLRDGATTLFPSVQIPDVKKPQKASQNQKVVTPSND